LVDRRLSSTWAEDIRASLNLWAAVDLDRNFVFDFVNLARGVYSPLTGLPTRNDFRKVVHDMTLESGVAWPLPVVLDMDSDRRNELGLCNRIGLRGPRYQPST
jgi:sulfate adenylyltransferase